MKKLRVFEYAKCDSCRRALRFLDEKKVGYEKSDITLNPPSLGELKQMLSYQGEIRKLFNTSGIAYKELKLSEKLPKLSESEALSLLASNGRLVKRPFVLGNNFGLLGFRQPEWEKVL